MHKIIPCGSIKSLVCVLALFRASNIGYFGGGGTLELSGAFIVSWTQSHPAGKFSTCPMPCFGDCRKPTTPFNEEADRRANT